MAAPKQTAPQNQVLKVANLGKGQPEIFATLQGEGPTTGSPATFLRLSHCNLHCTWCDTPYTWNWHGTPWAHQDDAPGKPNKYRQSEEILPLDIQTITQHLTQLGPRRLVITGGEPLLQQPALQTLLHTLQTHEPWQIEIETNGTISPTPTLARHVTQFNVSPKLPNSGNPEHLRLKPQALSTLRTHPNSWFKFVVTAPEDLSEIETLITSHHLPRHRTILMPEGRTVQRLQEITQWLASECLQRNLRLGQRLHVTLWGNTRGT